MADTPTDAQVKWDAIERIAKLVATGLFGTVITLAQLWMAYQQSKQTETLVGVLAESQKHSRIMMGLPPE